MKKILFTLLAVIVLATGAAYGQKTTRSLSAKKITGVNAGSLCNIKIVRSDKSEATVVIPDEYAERLHFKINKQNVVEVWINSNVKKKKKEKDFELTVYLPELKEITLSGISKLESKDEFDCKNVSVKLSGISKIHKLKLNCTGDLNIDVSGLSSANISATAKNLNITASGNSKLDIKCDVIDKSSMDISSLSSVNIKGDSNYCKLKASGNSKLNGKKFYTDELAANISGISKAEIGVYKKISAEASGNSSLRYYGNPEINSRKASGLATVKGK